MTTLKSFSNSGRPSFVFALQRICKRYYLLKTWRTNQLIWCTLPIFLTSSVDGEICGFVYHILNLTSIWNMKSRNQGNFHVKPQFCLCLHACLIGRLRSLKKWRYEISQIFKIKKCEKSQWQIVIKFWSLISLEQLEFPEHVSDLGFTWKWFFCALWDQKWKFVLQNSRK